MTGLIDGVGIWAWTTDDAARHQGKPALFLDRDGVVVHDVDFLRNPRDVTLYAGAGEVIASFNRAGLPVVVVTNQSGIARGYLSWTDFEQIEIEIAKQLSDTAGASLDAVFACGYHESGCGPLRASNHPWRKPNPGMLWMAAEQLGVRLDASWIVGDRARDLATGQAAGLAGGMHVQTGHGDRSEQRASLQLASADFEVRLSADIRGAVQLRDVLAKKARG